MKIYFKHSTRCPVSAGAKMEMDSYLKIKPENIEFELVDVIDNRDRSDELAEQFDIPHESPQVIITGDDGKVIWADSHRRVTKANIVKVIEEHS